MAEDYAIPLRRAVKDCSDRGLRFASKWASELLLAITPANRVKRASVPDAPMQGSAFLESNNSESALEEEEQDVLLAAQSYADAKEFLRAAHALAACRSARARFIRVYSRFLASEKKALRDWHNLDPGIHVRNPHQPPVPINTILKDLLNLVTNETDPWLLFLKALFLQRSSRREEAIEALITSLSQYPWNWSAWLLLGNCLEDADELSSILPLLSIPPSHPLVRMFQIKFMADLQQPTEEELMYCDQLLGPEYFPGSAWLLSMKACVLYHLHDYTQAESVFDKVVSMDPYRIDEMDIYSNILYVSENHAKLSQLAHHLLAVDKDRPEVCCLVGNHYSLQADHEKAVLYFRRATELDQTYVSAWMLMGHEYVEMKNSHAAIESYRRAVDANRKDYRAWYGLGQAYELLSMQHYALRYYQQACYLKPYDVRVWQAQGMCYQELGRPRRALECLKRALIGADPKETTINFRIAQIHHDLEEHAEASTYHQRVAEVSRADNRPSHTFSKSCLYVARYQMDKGGNLELAKDYLSIVATSNAEETGQATELLKSLKAMMEKAAKEEALP